MAISVARRAAALVLVSCVVACSAEADDPPGGGSGTAPDPLGKIAGVHMTRVSAYQVVEVPLLVQGGPAPASVPLVEGKDTLLRVFATTDAEYDGGDVTVRVHVGAGEALEATAKLPPLSADADLTSTLNVDVPGAAIAAGATLKVELGRVDGGGEPETLPAAEPLALPTMSAGASLKVTIVPVAYQADGSGRLPDTSEAQVAIYRDTLLSMYPTPMVDIVVREPMPWSGGVSAFGEGWDQLLMAIADLRQKDGATPDIYYYGIFTPAPSFGAYCAGGCVAGLSMAAGPGDPWARASIGLGFTGYDAAITAVHEIGHAHGRMHAPCQTYDSDPAYPHPGGQIGVWGYDSARDLMLSPQTPDVMGYCMPQWISDYTFNGLLERIRHVNQASLLQAPGGARTYERVRIGQGGATSWLTPIDLAFPPSAELVKVTVHDGRGAVEVEGQYYAFDHLEGGVLLFPAASGAVRAIEARVGEQSLRMVR